MKYGFHELAWFLDWRRCIGREWAQCTDEDEVYLMVFLVGKYFNTMGIGVAKRAYSSVFDYVRNPGYRERASC